MRLVAALVLLVGADVAGAAGAAPEQVLRVHLADRDVAVWKPSSPGAPGNASALIVFSHGFHGCSTQSTFLTRGLAAAGYLVLAPNHQDAGCGGASRDGGGWYPGKFLERGAAQRPELPFRTPKDWSDGTYKDRADDVRKILDAVLKEGHVAGVAVDPTRIGVAGHSLGGYTALGLAGAWPRWKDDRIEAVLALSAYAQPFLRDHDLGTMTAPVMYQGGTRDIGITPALRRPGGVYDRTSAPKYYVEFDGTGHLGWTDLIDGHHDLMVRYAVAFLDHVLRHEPEPVLTQKLPGVSDLRNAP